MFFGLLAGLYLAKMTGYDKQRRETGSKCVLTQRIEFKEVAAMKIPHHWARATAEDDSGRRMLSITCWRSSDASLEEARKAARSAAARALAQLLRGAALNRYAYGELPLREEVLKRIVDDQGELVLALTRNHYGAVILNTARVAFIDLDFPVTTGLRPLMRLFARLLGRPVPDADAQHEAELRQRLESFVADHLDHGFRIYRTLAGLRAIATHDFFEPTSPATLEMLETLGSDPLYVRLCKAQECFRARLTPKPWRCGCFRSPVRWPREDATTQAEFEKWDAQYAAAQNKYATCRLVGTLGAKDVRPEIGQVVQIHDRMTRCEEPLSLA